ncbi:putative ferroxidase [Durotheca rogersii]|uniref:putative ferroxidase n=1 Tax=Durotheca rogersii TaxID=419775 RepID=UPI00221EFCFE|nr:putative ferroxidase [Durotheca rogersii]KAI5857307.1 putative ferroxidase [Durotheca rogersii]
MHRGFLPLLVVLAQIPRSWAGTVTYEWNATWVAGSPDGFSRPVIGINGVWPCPKIEANVGDTVVVRLLNELGNQTTGLHFHGINQIGTGAMDGSVGASQCPLAPNHTVEYRFFADTPGTYWWHSHSMGQYPDGLRGALIIHDPQDPYKNVYEKDIIITLSDWFRNQTPSLMSDMIQPNNIGFAPPLPNSTLVNEGGSGELSVEPGKTYRLRLINWAAMFSTFIQFDSLSMDVITIDASYVQRQSVQQLRLSPGQRSDVLVTIPDDAGRNIPYLVVLDINVDYTESNPPRPIEYPYNFTGMLVTDSSKDTSGTLSIQSLDPFDDARLKPYDNQNAHSPVDKQWVLDFDYCHDANGYPRACFNNSTYVAQPVPSLYTATSLGENNTQIEAYGQVGIFLVEYGEVLEIILNNHDDAIHPFHLHGHQFQIIDRPASKAGNWVGHVNANNVPPKRDTVNVNPKSYVVLRIKADNPGVYLFHCHVEWHVEMGLTATLLEAPDRLRNYTIPQDHLEACGALGIPTTGNAAGNLDWHNRNGFATVPPKTYIG